MDMQYKKLSDAAEFEGRPMGFTEDELSNWIVGVGFASGDKICRDFHSNGDFVLENLRIWRWADKIIEIGKAPPKKWGSGVFVADEIQSTEWTHKAFDYVVCGEYTNGALKWRGQLSDVHFFTLLLAK